MAGWTVTRAARELQGQVVRSLVVAVAGLMIVATLLGHEHWDRDAYLGVVGMAHVALGGMLALKLPRGSPVHWLGLSLVLIGARFASVLLVPGWDSLGTGRFSLAVGLTPVAAGALLAFAQRFGAGDSAEAPRPRCLGYLDAGAVPIGIGIGLFALWNPGLFDRELFHAPWALFAVVRSLQHLGQNFEHSLASEKLRMKWLLLASLIWLAAPVPLFLQAVQLPGRIAVNSAATLVLAGTVVLVLGMLARGTLDPHLALQRTALVALLSTLAAFVLAVVETATSDLLLDRLGLPDGAGLWVGAGVAALLVRPLEQFLQPRVDRWLERWRIGVGETQTGMGGGSERGTT